MENNTCSLWGDPEFTQGSVERAGTDILRYIWLFLKGKKKCVTTATDRTENPVSFVSGGDTLRVNPPCGGFEDSKTN